MARLGGRGAVRAAVGLLGALALLPVLVLPAAPAAADGQGDVARISAQVASARKKADALADRLNAAESRAAALDDQAAAAQARFAAAEAKARAASAAIRRGAVQDYVTGGIEAGLGRLDDPDQLVRRDAYAAYLRGASADALDAYRAARSDLDAARSALQRRQRAQAALAAQLDRDQQAVLDQLTRLGGALSSAKGRAAAEAADAAARSARQRSAGVGPALVVAGGAWTCPVQGPHTFSNDFGAPRYGGGFHRHQGNDIISPRGTPIVANVSGTFQRADNGLGGLSYLLKGDDGITYYGAHLDHFAGTAPGHVAQGTLLGYVGNSGDARGGVTHLHFEVHPGGGGAVNPYPTLVRYC